MSEPVRITKQDLEEKVQAGWKKDALAEHYGLPMTQMTQALKQAGLKIRKFHRPKFELVDEVEEPASHPYEQEEVNMEATAVEDIETTFEEVEPQTATAQDW
jgi:hypothetical protein